MGFTIFSEMFQILKLDDVNKIYEIYAMFIETVDCPEKSFRHVRNIMLHLKRYMPYKSVILENINLSRESNSLGNIMADVCHFIETHLYNNICVDKAYRDIAEATHNSDFVGKLLSYIKSQSISINQLSDLLPNKRNSDITVIRDLCYKIYTDLYKLIIIPNKIMLDINVQYEKFRNTANIHDKLRITKNIFNIIIYEILPTVEATPI
jgi:hypothetical protein